MRYRKGSLNLNNFEDKNLLQFVADSRYVTHTQLFRFAQLCYYERNRPTFNWRIRRMVDGGLVRKQAPPMLNGDTLYSITVWPAGFGAPWDLLPRRDDRPRGGCV